AWPSAVATSAVTASTLAPVAARISAAVVSRRAASRPLTTTSQPASASATAQARPSPRLEAQTMALRPAMPRYMVHLAGKTADVVQHNLHAMCEEIRLARPLAGCPSQGYGPAHGGYCRYCATAHRGRRRYRCAAAQGRGAAHAARQLAGARCAD